MHAGVANAQSAYFAFSQFLAWSDQPIYVLEKDNDLDVAQLARQNALDILKVRPAGSSAACIAFKHKLNHDTIINHRGLRSIHMHV